MADANVTFIKPTKVAKPTRHEDELILSVVATWQRARAEARLEWARHNEETLFATRHKENPTVPVEAMQTVANMEIHLARIEPRTSLGAMALLEVVTDILTTRETSPEDSFAEGPVLAILINVAHSLSFKEVRLRR